MYICLLKVILFHKSEKKWFTFLIFCVSSIFGQKWGFWGIILIKHSCFLYTNNNMLYIERSGLLSRFWISYYQPLHFLKEELRCVNTLSKTLGRAFCYILYHDIIMEAVYIHSHDRRKFICFDSGLNPTAHIFLGIQ